MKQKLIAFISFFIFAGLICAYQLPANDGAAIHMPYQSAGLSDRQAAAHLLNRFAFGATPGEIDRVVKMGLANWLERQLDGANADRELAKYLKHAPYLEMSNREIAETYRQRGQIIRMAVKDGIISEKEANERDKDLLRRKLLPYAKEKGFHPMHELMRQLNAQKLFRAVYSQNQLREVLTDFWFNHFNVSVSDNQARVCVPSYERDAIRPHVLGTFQEMLVAVAKHPAMLFYLDNFRSFAPDSVASTMTTALQDFQQDPDSPRRKRRQAEKALQKLQQRHAQMKKNPRRASGLNENFARELMELHTLGVDGGYTQKDVQEVARAFTGWTIVPLDEGEKRVEKQLNRGKNVGFVRDGDFLFRADRHDAAEKIILGEKFPSGGGVEEGYRVLAMLAQHPATARHVSRKLAARFVSDDPPAALVEQLANIFLKSGGDLREMIIAIAESPEFWSQSARRSKIKSPFELAASALRALDAHIRNPRETILWIERMGQALFAYQAPTGFPDNGAAWINSGSLLNRMNFGLQLATGEIKGANINLLALNHYHEPESLPAAVEIYLGLLLPERDHSPLLATLLPMAADPQIHEKIAGAASQAGPPARENESDFFEEKNQDFEKTNDSITSISEDNAPYSLARVVGVILGAPEFQRK